MCTRPNDALLFGGTPVRVFMRQNFSSVVAEHIYAARDMAAHRERYVRRGYVSPRHVIIHVLDGLPDPLSACAGASIEANEEEHTGDDEAAPRQPPPPPPQPPLEEMRRFGPLRDPEPRLPALTLTGPLDAFIQTRSNNLSKAELMDQYLRSIRAERGDSMLLLAELAYLFFQEGPRARIVYSAVHSMWHVWQGCWRDAGQSEDAVSDLFQCYFLPEARRLNARMSEVGHRVDLCKKLIGLLEDRGGVRKLIAETRKYFTATEIIFDQNPDLFAFANGVVLDLKANIFRYAIPKDYCRRTSALRIPGSWLVGDAYLEETGQGRSEVRAVLWAVFKREGGFHPGNMGDALGLDQT